MMTTATHTRLTEAEINEKYNGRWVLLTDFVEDPQTLEWTQAVVLADAPPEDNSSLFALREQLRLKDFGILFIGKNPYPLAFLL
jgi:hypothetical protein